MMIDPRGCQNEIVYSDDEEWIKVRPPRRKKLIELKDLKENDFLSLIEAKNQDKRFYGWLNFQPLFQGIDAEEQAEIQNRNKKNQQETEMEEEDFLFFNDLFGLNMSDEENNAMEVDEEYKEEAQQL